MSDIRRQQDTPDRHRGATALEERAVRVEEGQLSDETNARLTEDAREVVGAERVAVPTDRARPSHGEVVTHRPALPGPLPGNFLIGQIVAALVVVGAVAALAVGVHHWWALVLAIVVLVVMGYLVLATIMRMTSNPERPSPSTVAAMEEEGVADPEELFSDIVGEFTPDTGAVGENRRTVAVEDDPTAAAAEHRTAVTPSGGPSQPTGP